MRRIPLGWRKNGELGLKPDAGDFKAASGDG
jgi:hypothetical protein